MQSSLSIITPAQDVTLVSLYETKMALGLVIPSVSLTSAATLDDQLEMIIEWASGEIATLCNRSFARETVAETFRDANNVRIFLSRYPVESIDSVVEAGNTLVANHDYDLDVESGTLTRLAAVMWQTPVTITYTGGYDMPHKSPLALRQATLLMAREAYFAMLRGDATVRMISHKDSRVIYFDPNAIALKAMSGGGAGGSPARRAIGDLLKHFMRFWV